MRPVSPSRWYTPWIAALSGFVLTAALQFSHLWPQADRVSAGQHATITIQR